jgi:hypothetical protein
MSFGVNHAAIIQNDSDTVSTVLQYLYHTQVSIARLLVDWWAEMIGMAS